MFEMMKKKEAIVVRMECYLHNTRGQNVLQERTRVTRGRVQDLSVWRLGHHCHWLGGAGAAGPRRPAQTGDTGPWLHCAW